MNSKKEGYVITPIRFCKMTEISGSIGSRRGARSVSETTVFKVSIDCRAITYSGVWLG